MTNLVIFASDAKGTSSLNSIINEANNRGINLFVMVCQDTQLRYPTHHKDRFEILTNVDSSEKIWSKSLNTFLPFKPDWLIIQRERWEPETSIILEFKQSFGCKIGVVEQNAAFLNTVESYLENKSKNKLVPLIDMFFDHSEFIQQQRKLLNFKGNSLVVGNPKYDINLDVDKSQLEYLNKKYKVDSKKKQVLFFTLTNSSREELFKCFIKFKNENPSYQYFIKPFPGEPFSDQYKNDYFPKFKIEGITPILDETDIWGMFNICDIHVGALSSIFYPGLLLNKTMIDYSKEIGMRDRYTDPTPILESKGIGLEDKAELWMRVFNLKSKKELQEILSPENLTPAFEKNKVAWDAMDNGNILNLFDNFNDKKACSRIINYIINETNLL